jgi:hypothetical protein
MALPIGKTVVGASEPLGLMIWRRKWVRTDQ